MIRLTWPVTAMILIIPSLIMPNHLREHDLAVGNKLLNYARFWRAGRALGSEKIPRAEVLPPKVLLGKLAHGPFPRAGTREGGLLRCLGARSHCYCCLDPPPPLRGGEEKVSSGIIELRGG